jgi:phosphate-selective porin OprO/OprP
VKLLVVRARSTLTRRYAFPLAATFLFTVTPQHVIANSGDGKSAYDDFWRQVVLYKNPDNRFLQRFALSGRAQGDYAWFDADEGDYDRLRWRRFRFGFTSQHGDNWTVRLEGDFDLNNSLGDAYNRLTDAHIDWQLNEAISLKVLKHSAGFTLDGATSSKKLLTPERNNLTNNLWFTEEYFTGVSLSGEPGKRWSYNVGLFSSDADDEIGITDASYFSLLSLGREFSTGSLHLDYVYNDKDPDANTREFSHVASLRVQWSHDHWGLGSDFSYGDGYYDQGDVRGIVLMPFYNFTERWQLVLRATWLDGDGSNSLRLNRYENRIVDDRGDEYLEAFAGINLFLYGHKLKWQNGLQYADMDDNASDGGRYNGWGFTSGLRVYW